MKPKPQTKKKYNIRDVHFLVIHDTLKAHYVYHECKQSKISRREMPN